MIQLIAKCQDGFNALGIAQKKYALDILRETIELNIQVYDLRDPFAKRSPYTFNFELPFTPVNNRFFAHYYEVNLQVGVWRASKRTDVEVYDEGILVFEGALQLQEVDVYKGQYKCTIVGAQGDFFEAIRGAKWSDVLDGALDHQLTAAKVIQSWDTTEDITGAGAGVLVYPLIDTSMWWHEEQRWSYAQAYGNAGVTHYGIGSALSPIRPQTLRPAVKVRYLFERIAAYAGYAIDSDFFTEDVFDNLYMAVGTHREYLASRPLFASKVGRTTNLILTTNSPAYLVFNSESGEFYDPDGLFANGIFTAPFDGTWQFTIRLQLTSTGTGGYTFFSILQTETNVWSHQQTYPYGSAFEYEHTYNVELAAGEDLYFAAKRYGASNVTILATGSYIVMPIYDVNGALVMVDVANNLVEVTMDKWIKAIATRYNLLIVADGKTLKVEPYSDYMEQGTAIKDWTDKVDWAGDISIEPTTEYQKKEIRFTDEEGKDGRNAWYQDFHGSVRGTYVFTNDNEFAVGTEEPESLFVPLRNTPIYKSWEWSSSIPNVLVPQQWQVTEGVKTKSVVQKPWLGYYHGTKDIGNGGRILIDAEETTVYPFFSEFTDSPVVEQSYGVNWGVAWPDHADHPLYNGGGTGNYLFRSFYAQMFAELYSDECRVMKCDMVLKPDDIRQLKLNDMIWIRDAYWRVLSVNNYAVSARRKCQVELIKVVNKLRYDCGIYPSVWNPDGTLSFESKPGVSAAATQECCEEYGYAWNPANSECYWKGSTNVGGNPNEPISSPFDDGTSPDTPTDWPNQPVMWSANFDNVNVIEQEIAMSAFTDGNVNVDFSGYGGGAIPLKLECVYDVEVYVNCVQLAGSAGAAGDASTALYKATFRTTAGSIRQIGTTTHIHHCGDFTQHIQFALNATSTPSLRIIADGDNNRAIQWTAKVKVTKTDAIVTVMPSITPVEGDWLWQNGDKGLWQDSSYMLWQ